MENIKYFSIKDVHDPKNKAGYPFFGDMSKWISASLGDNGLHARIKRQVLETCLLWAADFSGKLKNCAFISDKALTALQKWETDGDSERPSFVHEHVIPKKVIADWILDNYRRLNLDALKIERLLRLSVYCLVLKEEDRQLSKNAKQTLLEKDEILEMASQGEISLDAEETINKIWSRYRLCCSEKGEQAPIKVTKQDKKVIS